MTTISTRYNPRRLLRSALITAVYLGAFIALDLISHQFQELLGTVAWYPPAGLTYALLLVFGVAFTPAVTIALIISTVFVYRMPQPLYLLVLWAVVISSIYGAAAAFLHHRIHLDWQLRKARDVSWLVVTAVCVSALLAILSVSSSALTSEMPHSEVLRAIFIWWIGETVGVLTVAPFLLVHSMPRLKQFIEGQPVGPLAHRSSPRPTLSTIGQVLGVAVMFYWVFGTRGPAEFRPTYLLTIPLIWIALDHGFKGVTTGIVLSNFGVMLVTWFFRLNIASLAELQLVTIVNCLVGLLMGAVVTERKQAEQVLAQNVKLLNEVQEVSHIGGWMYDAQTKRLTWTREVYGIHELPPDYDPNDVANDIQFYSGDDRKLIEEAFGRAATVGEPYDLELQFITAKSNHRWVRTIGVPELKDGHVARIVGNIGDITERKQMEQEVTHLASFPAQNPLPVVELGVDGVVRFANPAAMATLARLGLDPDVRQFLPGTVEELALLRSQCERASQTQELHLGEATFIRVVAAPPGGASLRIYAIDITGRKQAEAQLRQSYKMRAIGELAGGVAHDFNNLLTGILGSIALVRGSLPPADPLLENLNVAEAAAHQAAALTKGLLTFSRSAVVMPVSMKITTALDVSLALLKQSLPATMNIVRDDEQPAWNVLLDQTQMTQILLNLGVNARDAMQGKGTLTMCTRNVTVDMAYVRDHSYARTGEFVRLSVTDTGPGMSADAMQHLFEPFYTTKPAGSGTGLGLSIVYGAVKQAGGWITVASTEGVGRTTPHIGPTRSGATFDIYLPRCLEEPKDSLTPSPTLVHGCGETLLVIEDEPIVSAVAQALLSRSGYTVLTALDGASALNVLREHPTEIRIVVLDMTMPGMTTDEIVHAIRALNPTIPILLNSGHTSNDTIRQMLEEGAVQGFLGKPYTLYELVGKVQELLHGG